MRLKIDGIIFLRQLLDNCAQLPFEWFGRKKPKAVLSVAGELRLWFNLHYHPCLYRCSLLMPEPVLCRARTNIPENSGAVAETLSYNWR